MELKKSIILLFILFVQLLTDCFAMKNKIAIRSVFNSNDIFCAVKTNDVPGVDNRYSALEGSGMLTSSSNSLLVLENGFNDFTLEVGALSWFTDASKDRKLKISFIPGAYCNVALTLFSGYARKVITDLKVTVDSNGRPQVHSSEFNKYKIDNKKIMGWQVEKGYVDDDYFIENLYPKGMTVYQFTQKVYLKDLPEWKWVKATSFVGKPEQILALQNAYNELWRLFAAKDNNAIKRKLGISLDAWSIATGSDTNKLYDGYDFVESFKLNTFKMIPINWNDYTLEIRNKGRLVRFVNKSDPTIYPISYDVVADDGVPEMRSFTPFFAIIDGKITPVI